jgi:hypothetical protein
MAHSTDGRFSKRYGLGDHSGDKLVRDDTPQSVRCGLLQITGDDLRITPTRLRSIVCGVLRCWPDPSNWSEYPNIQNEVAGLVQGCEWYRVYDIIEAIYSHLNTPRMNKVAKNAATFEDRINALFHEEAIGWKLVDGMIQTRGDEAFEHVVSAAEEGVLESEMKVAAGELHEAILDLSRRPKPDLSGAVHHAMAALESAVRSISGEPKPTLGDLLKKQSGMFPKPVDSAVHKLWGYASEQARHGRESRELAQEEARLVVGICAVLCSYLTQKEV